MNDKATDPQAIAERVGQGMFAEDAASRGLGMRSKPWGRLCQAVHDRARRTC